VSECLEYQEKLSSINEEVRFTSNKIMLLVIQLSIFVGTFMSLSGLSVVRQLGL
jgi:hypothetical protein